MNGSSSLYSVLSTVYPTSLTLTRQATAIFNNLKTELLGQLRAVNGGFSEGFSKLLKDKVTHLHEKLGYPDWVLDKDQVNNYYSNMASENGGEAAIDFRISYNSLSQ